MFNDAQNIQHNIQACKQIKKEGLDAQEHESEYEQKIVDWSLNHRIDNIMGPLEVSDAYDRAKNYFPLVKRKGVVLSSESSPDKQGADHFVDKQEDEFVNQFAEEQINVPSLFLLDDISYDVDFPIYDKYKDDRDIEDSLLR